MSTSILRRNSSIKRLQKLERLTAQRSLEDTEEIERERRRRTRASSSAEPQSYVTPQDTPHNAQSLDNQGQNDLVPRSPQSFEEDEGFSDWTQQLSRRKQRQMAQVDVEPHLNESHHSKVQLCSSSAQSKLYQNEDDMYDATTFKQTRSPLSNQKNVDEGDDEGDDVREKEIMNNIHKEKEFRRWCEEEENPGRTKDNESWRRENQRCEMDEKGMDKKAEMKISFTSTILLQQNGRLNSTNGHDGRQINETCKRSQRSMDSPVDSADLCTSESVSEDVFVRSSEENHQPRDTGDQVQRRMIEEGRDRRRRDVMEKLKRLSISSGDPEEPFSPLSPKSPAYMIAERTESLNRSIKKRNSIKKTQPPTIISKLDCRVEQYNHAVEESSKEGNAAKQPLMDVPTPEEPVSARKTLFEAGEAWNQTSGKTPPSKDTEGMKVGVADLINQWVKGNSDVSCKSPSSTTDVKAGEVRNIKSMWENMGETFSQVEPHGKGYGGKKYKFVVSGHGKYEKVFIEDDKN
ncbi:lymphocyte-specific protein 1 isoform X2 [Triplophysa dalaica]|uniref:lymphocyte-specific protein 1 isoform X2 n=1 Tax=Triplophysa dalaica TaxID=1582913 RepID=UPI0024DF949F|nr:lymphocyte-specific protein 1 isoform X2 [Triplophysa dalaica]